MPFLETTAIQLINPEKATRLKVLREHLGLKQSEFSTQLGTDQASIAKFENGKRPIGKNFEYKLLNTFNVSDDWWATGDGQMFKSGNAKIVDNDSVDLAYIPVRARATFAEISEAPVLREPFPTFRVIRADPGENLSNQVVIEIDGDSMEPSFISGTKVRCKEVDAGDWIYLNSGVYVVVYANFFVVKRVKNSTIDGVITLHSDNTETGGTTNVPLSDVRKIWKVLRVVDAPVR